MDFDFKAISDMARDALLADPYFSTIVVPGLPVPFILSEDPVAIPTAVQQALGQVNFVIVVLLPSCRNRNPNMAGPYFDDVTFHVKVFEQPNVNRPSGFPTAYQLTVNACRVLHLFTPDNIDTFMVVNEVIPVADPDFIVYQIGIKCSVGFKSNFTRPQIAQVTASPNTPSEDPQSVSLSCATVGAAIWYTLDGTYPAPWNPTSQIVANSYMGLLSETGGVLENEGVYLLPTAFTVNPGQLLRARAWLAGYGAPNPDCTQTQF